MKNTSKYKLSEDSWNEFRNRCAIILMGVAVTIFTFSPGVVQAQRGGPSHGGGGPGGPSHGHGGGHSMHHHHHHPGPHLHPGPMWHPIGFFITTIAVTAIVVSVIDNNKKKQEYKYDNGTYYQESTQDGKTGYVAVAAPIGAKVPTLPDDNTEITMGSTTYYYYASTFYTPDDKDYVVVQPPIGATVPYVPDGNQKKEVNGIQYYVYADIYYQAKSADGDVVYEVVEHPS
jgi:hypothetical protein